MSTSKRFVAWTGILIQGYAVYAGISHSLVWPIMWPKGLIIYPIVSLIYLVGNCMLNATLTSEFVRKTQLESDQTAARQIQQTLIPQTLEEIQGYQLETYYKPFRDVGGDYFDVIDLSDGRTLFAVADVSGKGMAAALLAANIQALVRSMATVDPDPQRLSIDQPTPESLHSRRSICNRCSRFARSQFRTLDICKRWSQLSSLVLFGIRNELRNDRPAARSLPRLNVRISHGSACSKRHSTDFH